MNRVSSITSSLIAYIDTSSFKKSLSAVLLKLHVFIVFFTFRITNRSAEEMVKLFDGEKLKVPTTIEYYVITTYLIL